MTAHAAHIEHFDIVLEDNINPKPLLENSERPVIFYMGEKLFNNIDSPDREQYSFVHIKTIKAFKILIQTWGNLNIKYPNAILIHESYIVRFLAEKTNELRAKSAFKEVPLIVFSEGINPVTKNIAFSAGADDYIHNKIHFNELMWRTGLEKKLKTLGVSRLDAKLNKSTNYKMYFLKRFFDIAVSFTSLVLLSPVMMFIAFLIKLDSKGPIFYISQRAGNNYKIFDFYKFRSMTQDADTELQKLKETSNQYEDGNQFVKIKNDPRVTRLGSFLRKTSLDELPQFINVLKGDMSIVGNRPLPLYEAELLMTDDFAERFLAPAGITGLWQALKRGKEEMSSEERIMLDRIYVRKNSVAFDFKIMLMTIPALLQSEKV